MSEPRRRLSELTSQELARRAIEYRGMALLAHGETTITALNKLAFRYAILAARRELEEASGVTAEARQDQPEIAKLIQLAEQAAATQPDPVGALADIIKTIAEGDADPYLVMGALVEGAVHTFHSRIPNERRDDTAGALVRLMADRLRANGFLGGP